MAVHRKRPVPRALDRGECLRRSVVAFGLLLAVSVGGVAAHAQDSGALSAGASSFDAGKYDAAVRQFTNAINAEDLAPNEAAKALFYRGVAYQRLKQPARAISDLGAAMWLGLSSSDRVSAMVNRGLAYRAAGLSEQAEQDFAAARKAGGSDAVERLIAASGGSSQEAAAAAAGALATAARDTVEQPGFAPRSTRPEPGSGFDTAVAAAETPSTQRNDATDPSGWSTTSSEESSGGSRLSRWWGSVREGITPGQSAPETPETAASASEPLPERTEAPRPDTTRTASTETAPEASSPPPEVSGPPPESSSGRTGISRLWGSVREGVGSIRGRSDEGAAVEATAPDAGAASGGYRLQLTPTRSEAEAQQLWQTVSAQNPRLAGASHRIERTNMGDLGTFYRLQLGPFPDKAESTKLCNALKRSGVDCFLVAP